MGWVEDKIKDDRATEKLTNPLWNSFRDSIGEAVTEFQFNVHSPDVTWKDCKAKAALCVRVEKGSAFIEVFLVKEDQTIRMVSDGTGEAVIAGYRLKRADRSALEFFREQNGVLSLLSADAVARLALESFLFNPRPIWIMRG